MLGYCDILENLNIILDYQQSGILRQRTEDVELKKYFLTLLENFGSLRYTRHTLEKIDAEIRAEIAKLGGNPILEDVMDQMLNWKCGTSGQQMEK
jgi:geranylgeranyl diphosphate synthase type 3